jgi:hypothetical protein
MPGPPDESDRYGALTHDPPCPACGHAWHHFLSCDRECGCSLPPAPGID